ncbi:hypothetical protein LTS12_027752 [Elasticomyces elasticus]|nr:hypothetical protein LTS12_027752 [Elasticomyces elasticus]
MHTIHITKTIKAPIDQIFDSFTDHTALAQVPGIWSAWLVKQGDAEPNGKGAIREIQTGLVWLREEIIGFDRPNKMEYRIRAAPPFPAQADHRFGQVDFKATPVGTEIIWTSIFAS